MSETVTIPAGVWKDALVKIDAQLKTNGELAAENERLRKAGDKLAKALNPAMYWIELGDWNAAKEGRDAK